MAGEFSVSTSLDDSIFKKWILLSWHLDAWEQIPQETVENGLIDRRNLWIIEISQSSEQQTTFRLIRLASFELTRDN